MCRQFMAVLKEYLFAVCHCWGLKVNREINFNKEDVFLL